LPSPGAVAASTTRRTFFGCRIAVAWAIIPPIDHPTTSARLSFSARMRDAVSSAIRLMVSVPLPSVERPMPSLSNVMTRCPAAATRSTKLGAHASMVPDRPMTKTTAGPLPTDR
jgi:hypothetical protein